MKLQKYLSRFIIALVYLLPVALYCSYYPIIKLGETASMNFELSLPLIWLVIFDIASFIALISHTDRTKIKQRRVVSDAITDRTFFLFSLFPFFATLSIFWSPNPTRAVLTAGIIWLLFFAVFALIYIIPLLEPPKNFKRNCLYSFLIASAMICVICWVQCFLDIAGLSRDATLMCRGCTYLSFGFPHPSGLAIEPQFMGNLLLAPTLTALYLLVFKQTHSKTQKLDTATLGESLNRWQHWVLVFLTCLFSATLFLTFSRGAIYAYAIALIVMLAFALRRHVFRISFVTIPIATFLLVVCFQGVFTIIGPTHGSFLDGVSRSIHQLSLGLIDFRPTSSTEAPVKDPTTDSSAPEKSAEKTSLPTDSTPESSETSSESFEQPIFSGYVAESTNARLDFNSVALHTWSQNPQIILFGVGLGGAGTAMHRFDPNRVGSPKEIVQNQGISLLLELGLVGIALILLGFYLAFVSKTARITFWRHPTLPLLAPLILAYLITLNFFSGLPNALQIYLTPPLLYLIFSTSSHSTAAHSPKRSATISSRMSQKSSHSLSQASTKNRKKSCVRTK